MTKDNGEATKPKPNENEHEHENEVTKPKSTLEPKKEWGFWEDLEEVMRRGPHGAPVYDNMGFKLDYKKVAPQFRRRARPSLKKRMTMMEKNQREEERKCEIMGMQKDKVSAMSLMAWDDRVSRDLGIPYHKVEMEHFEEWHRRGFVAEPGEFESQNIGEENKERILSLATGSAFRE